MISADDYLFCSRYQTKLKTSWGFLRSNLAKAFWVIRLQLEVTNYIILLDIFLFYVDTDYLYLAFFRSLVGQLVCQPVRQMVGQPISWSGAGPDLTLWRPRAPRHIASPYGRRKRIL